MEENSVGLEDDVALAHPAVAESVAARIEAANENGHLDIIKKIESGPFFYKTIK